MKGKSFLANYLDKKRLKCKLGFSFCKITELIVSRSDLFKIKYCEISTLLAVPSWVSLGSPVPHRLMPHPVSTTPSWLLELLEHRGSAAPATLRFPVFSHFHRNFLIHLFSLFGRQRWRGRKRTREAGSLPKFLRPIWSGQRWMPPPGHLCSSFIAGVGLYFFLPLSPFPLALLRVCQLHQSFQGTNCFDWFSLLFFCFQFQCPLPHTISFFLLALGLFCPLFF